MAKVRLSKLLVIFTGVAATVQVYLYVSGGVLRADNAAQTVTVDVFDSVDCDPGVPCSYPEEVDLRIIVMTFDRPSSLEKLLQSLDNLQLDGDKAALEIWIDRKQRDHHVDSFDESTLRLAQSFSWSRGKTRVHVHKKHVGIYGQWIDTWRPPPGGKELALFLEDDLTVSPYAYRWLKAVHKKYGSRKDIAGYTLQSEGVSLATDGRPLKRPANQTVFLYKLLGSWGYAPHPDSWLAFQDWYHRVRKDADFHPYVQKAARITGWYKGFERQNKQDTMWTMWHVYYCDRFKMFTVYNNIEKLVAEKSILLAQNRMEPGLHTKTKRRETKNNILPVWSSRYVSLPDNPLRYDFDGTLT